MMENTFNSEERRERVVLIGIDEKGGKDEGGAIEELMDELEELAGTAGTQVVARLVQKREGVHPGHYLGKGKVTELKELAAECEADSVICNDELSPAQMRNLSDMLNLKIIDRTSLILDIFAMRAKSAEGKVQVELAQLKYRLSHLVGAGKAMSRLGAGIGTRGPGETKLETDRRHIRNRVTNLRKDLEEIRMRRDLLRHRRERSGVPSVSLVGYTNAGKSTLMNLLSGSDVLVENKLFATLDTTTRRLTVNNTELLLTDTVGFIRKLPTELIEAFKSTIEELKYADILIHVVDAGNPRFPDHMDVVYATLASLDAGGIPVITAFNKADTLPPEGPSLPLTDPRAERAVLTQAINGEGVQTLTDAISEVIQSLSRKITILLPFTEGHMLDYVHKSCTVLSREHTEDGISMELYADGEALGRLTPYIKERPPQSS